MSEKHAGWKLALKINGQNVYFHKGRDQYAIERDHSYLGGLTQREQDILDGILRHEEYRIADPHDEPDYDAPDYRERPVGPGVRHVLGMDGW
jgi:hypothetical protein